MYTSHRHFEHGLYLCIDKISSLFNKNNHFIEYDHCANNKTDEFIVDRIDIFFVVESHFLLRLC